MRESIRRFDSTIRCLAERWSGAGLLLPAFPLLAQGKPLTVGQIAKASGVRDHEIEEALRKARCTFNDSGHVIDLFGMMLAPTNHRLEIDGRVVFSCCALWAHVIPKLVNQVILVESVDPQSRRLVRLEIAPDEVHGVNPGTAIATLAVANAASIEQDVGSAFCGYARYFASSDGAQRFAAASPPCTVVNISELHEIAGRLHDAILNSLGDAPSRHA